MGWDNLKIGTILISTKKITLDKNHLKHRVIENNSSIEMVTKNESSAFFCVRKPYLSLNDFGLYMVIEKDEYNNLKESLIPYERYLRNLKLKKIINLNV